MLLLSPFIITSKNGDDTFAPTSVYRRTHMPLAISSKDLKIKILRRALLKPWYFERTFAWNKFQLNCGYNEVVTRGCYRSYRSFGGTPIDRMKHGAPWIIKSLFTTRKIETVSDRERSRASRNDSVILHPASWKTIARQSLIQNCCRTRALLSRIPDMFGMLLQAVARHPPRQLPSRSPRSWRCIMAIPRLSAADCHFHSTLIASVLNISERKKKIFTQTRAPVPFQWSNLQEW